MYGSRECDQKHSDEVDKDFEAKSLLDLGKVGRWLSRRLAEGGFFLEGEACWH